MKNKMLCMFVIITVLLRIFPIFAADVAIDEDFEGYTGYVSGNWYGQGNGNIPIVPARHGNSACLKSTTTKMSELIHPFSELGDSVKAFKVTYSIYFKDNKADRSFYVKDSRQGEFPLISFNAGSNTVATNSGNVSAEFFTYKTDVWYDVTLQFNIADAGIKASISDGEKNFEFCGTAAKKGATRIHRINFVSFVASDGESSCYVDDISFRVCEPFNTGNIISSNGFCAGFENEEDNCFEVVGDNPNCYAYLKEVSGRNAYGLTSCDGDVTASSDYNFEKYSAMKLSFSINKQTNDSQVCVYAKMNSEKYPIMYFEQDCLRLASGHEIKICVDKFVNITFIYDFDSQTLTVYADGYKFDSVDMVIPSFGIVCFENCAQNHTSTVYIDSVILSGYNPSGRNPVQSDPIFENNDKILVDDDFNNYKDVLPYGFFEQITAYGTPDCSYSYVDEPGGKAICMSVSGGIYEMISTFDSVTPGIFNATFDVVLPDTNVMKAFYIRSTTNNEMPLIVFNTNGTLKIGHTDVSSSIFTYRTNTHYRFDISYNLRDGDVTVVVTEGDKKYSLLGNSYSNVKQVYRVYFVIFGTTNDISRIIFDNLSVSVSDLSFPDVFVNEEYADVNLVSSVPANGETSVQPGSFEVMLDFVSEPSGGRFLLNGTDRNITSICYEGNSVILTLKQTEPNTEYVLSYSEIELSAGMFSHGRIKFKTGMGISVSDIRFKDVFGATEVMNTRGTACCFTASSDTDEKIYVCAALYDKSGTRMINVNFKEIFLTSYKTEYELQLDVAPDMSRYNMKIMIFDTSLKPLKTVNVAPSLSRVNGEMVMSDLEEFTPSHSHPRLMTTPEELTNVKQRILNDQTFRNEYISLISDANKYLYTTCQPYAIPDGIRLLDAASQIRTRVEILGLAYVLSGDEKYAKRLYKELENAASFPDWNPKHFLDTATMLSAFALGYDYAYDYISLDEIRKQTIVNAVANMGFEPLLDDYLDRPRTRTYKWTLTNEPDNWNVVCNSGAIMAALSFAEELPEYASTIFDYAPTLLEKAALRFGPDGAWFEGLGYWDYTLNNYVDILMSLNNSLGTDYGFSSVKGLARTGYFLHAMTGSTGVFNFSNSSSDKIRGTEIFGLANVTGDKYLSDLHYTYMKNNSFSFGYRGMVSYKGDFEEVENTMAHDVYYRDTEVVSLRSGYSSDDTFVGFCAGENFVPHAHLDIGSFVLDMQGERFISDLGSENYNLGGNTWNLYRNRAEGHNVPVINPGAAPDQRTDASSVIDRFVSGEDESFAVCDMTDAYSPDALSALRGIKLTDNKSVLIVQDEIHCALPSEIYWFWHTSAAVTLSADGKIATLTKGGKSIKAVILSGGGSFDVMDAQPLVTSPQNDEQNKNNDMQKLVIVLDDVMDVTSVVAFMPADYSYNHADIIKIKNW